MRKLPPSVASGLRAVRRAGPVALTVAGVIAATLAGCGQKGPLTLPPPATAASAPAR